MSLCRVTLKRCSHLARHSLTPRAILHRDVVPRRLMSSVPGGSGENLMYFVLCGGAFAGGVTYAYRTITGDSARFNDRITEIEVRPKTEWKPKQWPPKSAEDAEEVAEEVVEVAAAEEVVEVAAAEEVVEVAAEEVVEVAAEEVVEVAAEAPAEALAQEAAPVELIAKKEEPASLVETAAEVVAEAAEAVAEVAVVVEETAEEVVEVAQEVEKIAKEVEAAAEALETPKEVTAESNGTEAATQEEKVTESVNTEA